RRTEATRSVRTHEIHRTACEALVAHFGADRPMHTVTTAEAEAFLHAPRGESGEPWAPATQASYRMVAGALWRYAIEREAEEAERQSVAPTLTRNPWRRARVRAARRSRPSVLTEEEIRDLLGHPAVAGTPREAFLAIAAYAGLRLQEITHLRTSQDVVLDGPRPMLRVQSRDGDHAWRPKTARSERDVRIPPVLVEILRRHIARGFAGTRYLFRAPGRDAPISSHTAREWTRNAFEAAGLQYGRDDGDGVTLHSLRHSHATILLSRGISIAAVADRLGDTQQIVLETYSHALPDDEERALSILDRIAREGGR
ncbi:MAG TPA: site-specific integrase, partial [Longimicrobiales bacterium]